MFELLKSSERGKGQLSWLQSAFTFSFADYDNPERYGFRCLRVINEDVIAGGGGFPTHPHRNMEIITYMIEGALEHNDTMGNGTSIQRDEVQTMSAGSGIEHSEFNHSKDKSAHLLQIWIETAIKNIPPAYGQKSFKEDFAKKNFVLVVSHDGRDGSLPIKQNVLLYAARPKIHEQISYTFESKRCGWVQVIKGKLSILDMTLNPGDGLAILNESEVNIRMLEDSEFLFFDLP